MPKNFSSNYFEDWKAKLPAYMPLPLTIPRQNFIPGTSVASNFTEIAAFNWSVADLLRGDYKQSDYGKVTLLVWRV
jgi:hypothetical protein